MDRSSPIFKNSWYINLKNAVFIALGLSIPLTTAGISISMILLTIFWVIERGYCRKIQDLCANPVFVATFFFFVLHLAGQYWLGGIQQINGFKSWMVFIIPLLASIVDIKTARKGLMAFVIGMLLSDLWLLLKIATVWDQYSKGIIDDLEGFYISGSRISFAPLIVIAFSIIYARYLHGNMTKTKNYVLVTIMIVLVFSIFYTGGRAGQVAFIISWSVLSVVYYKNNLKGLMLSILVLTGIIVAAYFTSAIFNKRVNLLITEVRYFVHDAGEKKYETSMGRRLHYIINGSELIQEKPWLGYGTGSYENVASKYLYVKDDENGDRFLEKTTNPHNYHILIMIQFGMVGFVIYIYMYIAQIYMAKKMPSNYRYKGLAFLIPIFYFTICFNDTYLWSHQLQALFALLTASIYRKEAYET